MSEILLRALLGASVLAAMLGPLGAFVVWRRMAYFGDTIAHASLLGVAISLLSGGILPMTLAVFLVAAAVAVVLSRYAHDRRFQADTLLGILSHGALAMGIVLVSLSRSATVSIEALLLGDVLLLQWDDVAVLAVMAMLVFAVLAWRWRRLLMATVHPQIAQIEGVSPAREQLVLTLLLAAVIAVAIKLTGILLITALLIMPAAAARYLASSPRQMAVLASVLGMVSVAGGLTAAFRIDAPAAPMMVVVAAGVFIVVGFFRPRVSR